MNPIEKLVSLGQSLWYDNIQRHLLENGELSDMITRGEIRGVTSNPSIYLNAITNTNDYDQALFPMALAGWDAESIFWQLAKEDIQQTCDLFLPMYETTKGGDGFVSLEVHPDLANDEKATLEQAKQLWEIIDRPNLMIKIPATKAGLLAVRSAVASGINVNVTLIFSINRYREVLEAYISGVEEWFASTLRIAGEHKGIPASVASFFISRIDTKIDALLPTGSHMRGKAAIASARAAYAIFEEVINSPRWQKLKKMGASVQRPLWASTSTKNPAYPDTIYIDELIGPDTVNTVPPQTLAAFRERGNPRITLQHPPEEIAEVFTELDAQGISIEKVAKELEIEGVQAFSKAFASLINAIDCRRNEINDSLGSLSGVVKLRIASLEKEGAATRIWAHDASLWTMDPKEQDEIRHRMGWLDLPLTSQARLTRINKLGDEIQKDGIGKVLLLGMGGSSLAPEVLSKFFSDEVKEKNERNENTSAAVEFGILDSTDPGQVIASTKKFPPNESLYIVSSKSGGTEEVKALTEYFWNKSNQDGGRFVAITDPGTVLGSLANERNFRATLLADPAVGGRFSVFTDFGLLPMRLMGIDPARMLAAARLMMNDCRGTVPAGRNPGLVTGAVLGEAALGGRDKLTLIADPQLASFGSWLEQLIAESTGKQGKGIVVIDGEPITEPQNYGADRLFVHLKKSNAVNPAMEALKKAGHPVLEFVIPDLDALSHEFYRWEIATAVACHILGINAFNQPDVQDNKDRTKKKIETYQKTGLLEEPNPTWEGHGIKLFSNQIILASGWNSILSSFIKLAALGDYIALNAYLPRNEEILNSLMILRQKVGEISGVPTTLGFGPRFLHSTGQLHKGGPESSLFIQLTANPEKDIEIPTKGNPITFGILQKAQAIGDYEALEARGRRILRLHLTNPDEIRRIADDFNG